MSFLVNEKSIIQGLAEVLTPKLKELMGGGTLAELADKYGHTHRLCFKVNIVDNAIEGSLWLEEKT